MIKVLSAFLAITSPIWFIPVCLILILYYGFMDAYKSINKLLEAKVRGEK